MKRISTQVVKVFLSGAALSVLVALILSGLDWLLAGVLYSPFRWATSFKWIYIFMQVFFLLIGIKVIYSDLRVIRKYARKFSVSISDMAEAVIRYHFAEEYYLDNLEKKVFMRKLISAQTADKD